MFLIIFIYFFFALIFCRVCCCFCCFLLIINFLFSLVSCLLLCRCECVCARICVYVLCFRTLYQPKRAQLLGVLFFLSCFFCTSLHTHSVTCTHSHTLQRKTQALTDTLAHTHTLTRVCKSLSLDLFSYTTTILPIAFLAFTTLPFHSKFLTLK